MFDKVHSFFDLQAVVFQSSFHCLIFEHTTQVDLHEYLVLNRPDGHSSKKGLMNQRPPDNLDFLEMSLRVFLQNLLIIELKIQQDWRDILSELCALRGSNHSEKKSNAIALAVNRICIEGSVAVRYS